MTEVTHINPEGLPSNPAFTQAVKVAGATSLVFIGGQNGVDTDENLVADDVSAQTRQALENVKRAVEAAGGSIEGIVKWTIAVTDPASVQPGFAGFQEFWGERPDPPAVSLYVIAGLANPAFLVEVEAVAVIPR